MAGDDSFDDDGTRDGGPSRGGGGPSEAGSIADEDVVAAAVEAAEDVIFSRYRTAAIRDLDVAVRFSEGVLEVDVYLNVPDADDAGSVADDAALAARAAVDDLLE